MSVIEARWSRDAHLRGLHCCLGEVPRLLRQRCLTSLRLVCSALDEGLMCWQGSGDGLGAAGLARGGAGRTRFPTPPSGVVVGVSGSQGATALACECPTKVGANSTGLEEERPRHTGTVSRDERIRVRRLFQSETVGVGAGGGGVQVARGVFGRGSVGSRWGVARDEGGG